MLRYRALARLYLQGLPSWHSRNIWADKFLFAGCAKKPKSTVLVVIKFVINASLTVERMSS